MLMLLAKKKMVTAAAGLAAPVVTVCYVLSTASQW